MKPLKACKKARELLDNHSWILPGGAFIPASPKVSLGHKAWANSVPALLYSMALLTSCRCCSNFKLGIKKNSGIKNFQIAKKVFLRLMLFQNFLIFAFYCPFYCFVSWKAMRGSSCSWFEIGGSKIWELKVAAQWLVMLPFEPEVVGSIPAATSSFSSYFEQFIVNRCFKLALAAIQWNTITSGVAVE